MFLTLGCATFLILRDYSEQVSSLVVFRLQFGHAIQCLSEPLQQILDMQIIRINQRMSIIYQKNYFQYCSFLLFSNIKSWILWGKSNTTSPYKPNCVLRSYKFLSNKVRSWPVYSSPLPNMVSHILEVFVIVIWGRYLIKQLNDCTQGHSY